jgi:hypothetical protein
MSSAYDALRRQNLRQMVPEEGFDLWTDNAVLPSGTEPLRRPPVHQLPPGAADRRPARRLHLVLLARAGGPAVPDPIVWKFTLTDEEMGARGPARPGCVRAELDGGLAEGQAGIAARRSADRRRAQVRSARIRPRPRWASKRLGPSRGASCRLLTLKDRSASRCAIAPPSPRLLDRKAARCMAQPQLRSGCSAGVLLHE